MRAAAEMSTLDAWYDHLDVDQVMDWVHGEVRAKRLGKKEAQEAAEDVDEGAGRATTCACSGSGSARSTASCGSSPTRR